MKKILVVLVALCATACVPVQKAQGDIEERTITITEDIDALAISSGFDVTVDPTLPRDEMVVKTHSDIFDKLDVGVEGTVLKIGIGKHSLRADTLEARIPAHDYNTIAISAGADLKWECCDVEGLSIATAAGADVEIEGKCINLSVAASAGSNADLDKLIANNVSVAASAGASIDVCATESISAVASSGADISYSGNPKERDIETSSGGSVRAK